MRDTELSARFVTHYFDRAAPPLGKADSGSRAGDHGPGDAKQEAKE